MVRTSSAGSHAGRGFRFQDSIGVWLVTRFWSGELSYGEVIPEGRDDYEIRGVGSSAFVQVKSRRDHLGSYPVGDVAQFVRALWERAESSSYNDRLILILERAIVGGPTADHRLEDHQNLTKALYHDPRWSQFASRTHVWIVSTPFETALTTISQTMPCSPLAAQIYYGELLSKICYLADANGLIKEGSFEGLTVSDVETSVRRLEPILDLTGMEEALRDGYCDAVDFLSTIDDATFYQGVDTRPGHLAAGLVVERPELCQEIQSVLESHGAALIVGPSGAGKSALMWETARATRHAIRWFEVKRGDFTDNHLFIRLARTLRASSSAPIGFVLDDIGRGFSGLWDALVKESSRETGLLLLGSIREEDIFILSSRSRAREIRPVMSEAIAELVWKKLKDQEQTTWAGWREPWLRSDKLLLEYAHILTRGDRLEIILGEQVDRRIKEARDMELSVLRVISLAGAAGATLDVERLSDALDISENDLTRALRRLTDEHLIAQPIDGRLRGLHQLRSFMLFNLCHAYPPPMPSRTVKEAVHASSNQSLEALAIYVIVHHPTTVDALLYSLSARLEVDPDPMVAAAIFSGLGQAHIESTLKRWIHEVLALGLEPTQITTAVIFTIAGTDLSSLPFPDRLKAACEVLQTRSASDPRLHLISLLSETSLSMCIANSNSTQLRSLLCSLVGLELPEKLRVALSTVLPDFNSLSLVAAAELLSAVQMIDKKIATAWANNQIEDLLARVPSEIPWANSVRVEIAPEGRLLRSSIFHVAFSVQTNIHEDVVQLCEYLFGLDPTADIVAVDAIGADGKPSGFLDFQIATKRIPRENLPPSDLPKWNRRWTAAAARLVGSESYSNYLQRAHSLLEQLVPVLERTVDTILRGKKPPNIILERLGEVYVASQALTPPREEIHADSEPQHFTTPLQNLLFSCSADLIRRFLELPDGCGAYVMWSADLIKTVYEVRKEPWHLIGDIPEENLLRLESVINGMPLLAVEADMHSTKPVQLFISKTKNAGRNNALRIARISVEESLRRRSAKYFSEVQVRLMSSYGELELHTRPNWGKILPCPNMEFLAIVDIESPADWLIWLIENQSIVRTAIGESRQIWIIPRIGGLVVSKLTVSGVITLLSAPYSADDWLDTIRLHRLDDILSREAQVVVDLINELDGLNQFNLGLENRPLAEKVILNTIKINLAEALSRFELLAAGKTIASLPREFCEGVENKEIALAESLAALSHGQLTSDGEMLLNLMNVILIEDLMVDLQSA